MKITLAVLCGLILLAGVPLIVHNWPKPTPPFHNPTDAVAWYSLDFLGSSSLVLPNDTTGNQTNILLPPHTTCYLESDGKAYKAWCWPVTQAQEYYYAGVEYTCEPK